MVGNCITTTARADALRAAPSPKRLKSQLPCSRPPAPGPSTSAEAAAARPVVAVRCLLTERLRQDAARRIRYGNEVLLT